MLKLQVVDAESQAKETRRAQDPLTPVWRSSANCRIIKMRLFAAQHWEIGS